MLGFACSPIRSAALLAPDRGGRALDHAHRDEFLERLIRETARRVLVLSQRQVRRQTGVDLMPEFGPGDQLVVSLTGNISKFIALTVEEIVETLLHEAAHAMNFEMGIRDCSASQYHNQRFRDAALRLGLEVTQVRHYGYALTMMPPETAAIYKEEIKSLTEVLVHRRRITPTGARPSKPSRSRSDDVLTTHSAQERPISRPSAMQGLARVNPIIACNWNYTRKSVIPLRQPSSTERQCRGGSTPRDMAISRGIRTESQTSLHWLT